MTGNAIDIGDIKQPRYMAYLEDYLESMKGMGYSERSIKAESKFVRRCFKVLAVKHGDVDPSEITTEMLDESWEDFGDIQKVTVERYLCALARFTYRVTGREVFASNHSHRSLEGPNGFMRKRDTCNNVLESQLDGYRRKLLEMGASDTYIEYDVKFVRHCMNLLSFNGVCDNAMDCNEETMKVLEGLFHDITPQMVRRYMLSFGRFICHLTGRNPYMEEKRPMWQKDTDAFFRGQIREGPFKEDVTRYYEAMHEMGYRFDTIRNNINSFNVTLPILEDMGIDDLSKVETKTFMYIRNRMPGVKDITARTRLRSLGKLIEYTTGHNPYKESMMLWNNDVGDRKFIFEDGWERLKSHSDTADMLILALGGGMGLRRAEIAQIKLADIVGSDLIIRGKGHGPVGKEVRKRIPESVLAAIRSYLPYRQMVLDLYGDHSDGNLLVRTKSFPGEPMTPDCVYNAVRSLAKRANVDCTTHSLRRLYATTLSDAGTDLNVIRKMMRHESLDTTLQCYINVDPRKISTAEGEVENRLFA